MGERLYEQTETTTILLLRIGGDLILGDNPFIVSAFVLQEVMARYTEALEETRLTTVARWRKKLCFSHRHRKICLCVVYIYDTSYLRSTVGAAFSCSLLPPSTSVQ